MQISNKFLLQMINDNRKYVVANNTEAIFTLIDNE